MPADINTWLAVIGAIISALGGILTGVSVATWWISKRDQEHLQLIDDVKQIKESCPTKHIELMGQLKEAVCSGFKLAIKELGSDFDKKLSERDGRISGHAVAIAVLEERMKQSEADIEAIFGLFNRRDLNQGRPEGERRHGGD